ncbi:hypothetical protein KC316_g12345 [Hortaea werneckii]|nr:hypothetical protein KC324_g12143 [Hortaea werneckii]KAI7568241.1 hypothetical protein KC316_g12345 [Hortaea werneckii]
MKAMKGISGVLKLRPTTLPTTAFTSRLTPRGYATIIPPADTEPKHDSDTWGSHMSNTYIEVLNALLQQQHHTNLVSKLQPIDLHPDTTKAAGGKEILCAVMLTTKIGVPLNEANEIHVRIMQEINTLNPSSSVSAEQFHLAYFTSAKNAMETFSKSKSNESSARIAFAVRDLKTSMATRELMHRLARSVDLLEVRCCMQTDPQRILVWAGSARL